MGWTFVFMMFVLKIPIAALLYIVWWAIRQYEPEEPVPGEDGGVTPPHRPRVPGRRPPRRGPHGSPGSAVAPRTRRPAPAVAARTQLHP